MHFMKENVMKVDENDAKMWELLTDVPVMKTPFQYVALLLNVLIPGKRILKITTEL